MASSSRRAGKMPATTTRPTLTATFLSSPHLLSTLLSFLPWPVFLALSQTSRPWRRFLEVTGPGLEKRLQLRNVVLSRYVDGFGKVLRDVGPQSHALRDVDLCWEDLVLLLISQHTPLHTYPTHALSILSPSNSRSRAHRSARLARMTLAHSRFVLLLQSIAHSSPNSPPQEEEVPPLEGSARGHSRASSAGSVRELVFPAPLTAGAEQARLLASRSMTNINVAPAVPSSASTRTHGRYTGHARAATDGPNTLGKTRHGARASSFSPPVSTGPNSSTVSLPPSKSVPAISIYGSPSSTAKRNRRLSITSIIGKSSPFRPLPPATEPRALRVYSAEFGWRRGLTDAKGRWETTTSTYRSSSRPSTLVSNAEIDIDDEELFSTPRRRFVGSDGGISGSESSFSEGTGSTLSSSSTSASNSTSATSISFGDSSPPPLPPKDTTRPLSGADVLAMNRGRVRPSPAAEAQAQSRPPSQARSVFSASSPTPSSSPARSGVPSRASTLGPAFGSSSRGKRRERLESIVSLKFGGGVDPDHNNPHSLKLATSRIRAPVLRVFVPCSEMKLGPLTGPQSAIDNGGVSRCEEELLRAGLWEHLSVGDVVCNLGYVPPPPSPSPTGASALGAMWLIFNGWRLVPFEPGAQGPRGVLPVYTSPAEADAETEGEGQEVWALPGWGYYEHLLQQSPGSIGGHGGARKPSNVTGVNMRVLISQIPVTKLHLDVMPEPTLLSVPTCIPSPHTPGGTAVVRRWVWTVRVWIGSAQSSTFNGVSFAMGREPEADSDVEVGAGWEGEWVLEGDGTKEGRDVLLSCLSRDPGRRDLMEWEVVRNRCGRNTVWLRLLNPSVVAS